MLLAFPASLFRGTRVFGFWRPPFLAVAFVGCASFAAEAPSPKGVGVLLEARGDGPWFAKAHSSQPGGEIPVVPSRFSVLNDFVIKMCAEEGAGLHREVSRELSQNLSLVGVQETLDVFGPEGTYGGVYCPRPQVS